MEAVPMSFKRAARPVIVLVLALFLCASAGFGQTRRHDLALGFGVLSMDQVTDIFTDVITVVLTMGTFGKVNQEFSGVPFLTYHYAANSRFGVGAAIGGYSDSGDLRLGDDVVGTFRERNYIAAVELDYHWLMKPNLQMYSGVGFGVRFRRGTYTAAEADTVSKILPTFHLNAIGLRFGRKIGFFLEAGVGYKGMLSGGLDAQF
jgi:hypothetical protein